MKSDTELNRHRISWIFTYLGNRAVSPISYRTQGHKIVYYGKDSHLFTSRFTNKLSRKHPQTLSYIHAHLKRQDRVQHTFGKYSTAHHSAISPGFQSSSFYHAWPDQRHHHVINGCILSNSCWSFSLFWLQHGSPSGSSPTTCFTWWEPRGERLCRAYTDTTAPNLAAHTEDRNRDRLMSHGHASLPLYPRSNFPIAFPHSSLALSSLSFYFCFHLSQCHADYLPVSVSLIL